MQSALGDPEFRERLAKLLAVLSTENPAEAEAARQKLREHLASRRLSVIDLAQHLAAAPAEPDARVRETERLRAANRVLEQALQRSRAEALAALQRAVAAEKKLGPRRGRIWGRTAAGWAFEAVIAALTAGMGAAGWTLFHNPAVQTRARPAPQPLASAHSAPPAPASPAPDSPVFSWQPEPASSDSPGAWAAFVRIDRAALRQRPSPDAALRALLPRGLPIVVLRTERRSGQDWSLVQTPEGQGYVAAAAIAAAR